MVAPYKDDCTKCHGTGLQPHPKVPKARTPCDCWEQPVTLTSVAHRVVTDYWEDLDQSVKDNLPHTALITIAEGEHLMVTYRTDQLNNKTTWETTALLSGYVGADI